MNALARKIRHAALGAAALLGILLPPAAGAQQADRLTLRESVALAVERSVLLSAAREGIRENEARQKEAFTGFLPKFSTAYSYTRLNEDPSFFFAGIPPLLPARQMTAGTKDNFNWTIEARQPLFAGGALLSNYEANRLGVAIARQEETAIAQDLVLEVKAAYFNVLKAQRVLAVAGQSLEQLTAHRDTARALFEAGLIPRNDLLQAEVRLANGSQLLLKAQNALAMARAAFNTLLRQDIDAAVQIEDILSEAPYGETLERCTAAALEKRPELRASALRVTQAQSLVKISAGESYPSVNLVGNYGRFGDTPGVSGTPFRDQESWSAMVVANWTFWDWGKTKNRVEAGRSRENQAADLLAHTRDRITLEVKNAYLLLREAEKQLLVSRKAIEQAQENFRINSERYREQVGTAIDVIDAQTLLTQTRSDYAIALSDRAIQQARLERAMGEDLRGEGRP
jgi:outer membrane protein TolC